MVAVGHNVVYSVSVRAEHPLPNCGYTNSPTHTHTHVHSRGPQNYDILWPEHHNVSDSHTRAQSSTYILYIQVYMEGSKFIG